jgi:hypothetical protein
MLDAARITLADDRTYDLKDSGQDSRRSLREPVFHASVIRKCSARVSLSARIEPLLEVHLEARTNLFLNAFDIGELAATPARTRNQSAMCTARRRREVGSKRVGRRALERRPLARPVSLLVAETGSVMTREAHVVGIRS